MAFDNALSRIPSPARDREVIRVDPSCDKMGIAAALRQAFASAAQEPCDHDFDKLLSELH